MKHLRKKKRRFGRWFFFFPSDTIFKKSFSTALLCSSKPLHPSTPFKRSVQFYHYEYLNFVYSPRLTFLLSSSWHRPNLVWTRVPLSPTPPLPALAAQEQQRASVKSHRIPSRLIFDISPTAAHPLPASPAPPLLPVTHSRHGSPSASSFRSSSLYTRTSLDEGLEIRKGEMSTRPPGSVGGRERPSPQALRQRDRPGP